MSQGSPRTGTAELNIGFVSLITVSSMGEGIVNTRSTA